MDEKYGDRDIQALIQMLTMDDESPILARPTIDRSLGRSQTAPVSHDSSATNMSGKSWLYKNARLPPGMVPFRCYVPTWTLVCRAAKAALRVYEEKQTSQREIFVGADSKAKTKAMIIKAEPVDERSLVIIAIRGSRANKFDWSTNVRWQPTLPAGFLDDDGNACHDGFLDVARQMVGPIAEQLERTFEQDPSYAGNCSVVFTGHSAGGAVASLLYCHMLGMKNSSRLTDIASSGFIRRIHCVTFGTPPISLLPLQKPPGKRHEKHVFFSFINEGDPVVRMDNKDYVLSLAKLMASPAPIATNITSSSSGTTNRLRAKLSRPNLLKCSSDVTSALVSSSASWPSTNVARPPSWPVPPATLSNPGRLVLLREKPYDPVRTTEAVIVSDSELRNVVFGDRAMHSMEIYKKRVDGLAFAAMSGA